MTLTVDSTAVRNEADGVQLVHEVLECGVRNTVKLRLQKSLDDPKTVPVILLPEPPT